MSPKQKQNTARVTLWIPPDAHGALKSEAAAKGLTVSALMRMLLLEHVASGKKEKE